MADTNAWLVRVGEDLRGAEVDLAAAPPLLGDAMFHRRGNAMKTRDGILYKIYINNNIQEVA